MKKTTKWVIASVILSYAFWVIFPMINNAKPIGTVLNVDVEKLVHLPASSSLRMDINPTTSEYGIKYGGYTCEATIVIDEAVKGIDIIFPAEVLKLTTKNCVSSFDYTDTFKKAADNYNLVLSTKKTPKLDNDDQNLIKTKLGDHETHSYPLTFKMSAATLLKHIKQRDMRWSEYTNLTIKGLKVASLVYTDSFGVTFSHCTFDTLRVNVDDESCFLNHSTVGTLYLLVEDHSQPDAGYMSTSFATEESHIGVLYLTGGGQVSVSANDYEQIYYAPTKGDTLNVELMGLSKAIRLK